MICDRLTPIALATAVTLTTWRPVQAQWTVTVLGSGYCNGVSGGRQVGAVGNNAALWNGNSSSLVSLHPVGVPDTRGSSANACNANQQVGGVEFQRPQDPISQNHAALWSGSAASWIDLNPLGSPQSYAFGVDAGQQAGWSGPPSTHHAGIWAGSAASWVDLNPSQSIASMAFDTLGGRQVGWASVGLSPTYASLWSGTAESWINLNPAGETMSQAKGLDAVSQVGWVGDSYTRAALWYGSAASFVSLHPAGATRSEARAVSNGYQVGYVLINGRQRACMWTGSADSWEDLSGTLGLGWGATYAYDVSVEGNTLSIVGYGNNSTGNQQALLWTRTIPAPSGFTLATSVLLCARIRRRLATMHW